MSELQQWTDPWTKDFRVTLVVRDGDLKTWPREQVEMVKDGIWLIQQAIRGRIEGPLTTPNLKLPVRGGDSRPA